MKAGTEAARTGPTAAQVAAVACGNALEFYDFLTYAFFAGQIGRTFFPSTHAGASLLASLAAFGAGFLMRPVGALVFGRIADRTGRKPAMLLSFSLMGGAMVLLALIPSPAHIGLLAPVLVIACRLAQGFALGGEVGPSTAFLIEAAPLHRRGLYVSFQYWGQDIATLAAGMVGYGLSQVMTGPQLDSWGWRIAFLVGALILPFGLLLRRNLPETHGANATVRPQVPAEAARIGVPRLAVLGLAILAGSTVVSYILNYLTPFATETLGMPASVGFIAAIINGGSGVIFDPVGGWLADRYGRRPVMIAPWVVLLLVTVPAFYLIARDRSVAALIAMTALMCVTNAVSSSAQLVALTEGLPQQVRAGGLGMIYALSISVFGGSAEFVGAWLTGVTHSNLAPAWYMTAGVGVSLAAMLFMPETAPGWTVAGKKSAPNLAAV